MMYSKPCTKVVEFPCELKDIDDLKGLQTAWGWWAQIVVWFTRVVLNAPEAEDVEDADKAHAEEKRAVEEVKEKKEKAEKQAVAEKAKATDRAKAERQKEADAKKEKAKAADEDSDSQDNQYLVSAVGFNGSQSWTVESVWAKMSMS